MKKDVVVDCPACGRKVPYTTSNPWRPFCSQRCKNLDLGAWAAERYRIEGDAREAGERGSGKEEG